jgi:hypothetical protein
MSQHEGYGVLGFDKLNINISVVKSAYTSLFRYPQAEKCCDMWLQAT